MTLREIAADDTAFIAALAASGLPTTDLADAAYRYFVLDEDAWGGFGRGADALLRSVVVRADARGGGRGAALVKALVEETRRDGVQRLWLLTTGAAPFFRRVGWSIVQRSETPSAIAGSQQFASLCPASATLMVRSI
jgi:amino-acid N-acetyltransferase